MSFHQLLTSFRRKPEEEKQDKPDLEKHVNRSAQEWRNRTVAEHACSEM